MNSYLGEWKNMLNLNLKDEAQVLASPFITYVALGKC